MKSLLRLLLKISFKPNRSKVDRTVSGFTLIELLVAMIITFLILTPLLGFVVDVLNTDRKEQVKSNTEQEVQAALDFIAEDLGQAVYIYDQTGVNEIVDSLPAANPTNGTPILVFWKRQLMKKVLPANSTSEDCDPIGTDDTCNDSYVYSLVAYYLRPDTNNSANNIWCQPAGGNCPARITRYQYRDGVIDTNAPNPAYFIAPDPRAAEPDGFLPFNLSIPGDNLQEKMNQWPLQEEGGTIATFDPPTAQVLVNYIDTTTVPNVATLSECQNALGASASIVSPTNGNGFYACVDSTKTVARVTIRGSALRKMQNNATYNSNNSAFFPTASVQVQGLGVLGQ
ncbi:hormogonium polysaccharide secretion pseudopilin HpsC [Kamptonema animale CS-326]|jgi:type II secretory pathway pseudopilin PulG|uniref:hormogonium polysaccharide secretion pseudopilin HpsC n=1 Tax=Kamptonema animale TaxID=92934 RepID=UPI00232DF16C|nr:hormogonium polysaccharide secretion pseudopilin HpsC [Kamptonema animale]MDB9510324.1 hormogonium polysaccharide secretion pseudopilin HpsC [Kamptonema animale CS-326]